MANNLWLSFLIRDIFIITTKLSLMYIVSHVIILLVKIRLFMPDLS